MLYGLREPGSYILYIAHVHIHIYIYNFFGVPESYHQNFSLHTKEILEIISPCRLHQKILGDFYFVIGGSRLIMLHLCALAPSLLDGKFPSENRRKLSHPKKFSYFLGGLSKTNMSFSRKSSEKGPQNRSDSAKLSHTTKDSKKGFVEGDKGRTNIVFKIRKGNK